MPRLKNANHERFAREYAKQASKPDAKVVNTRIYQKVYPDSTYDSARTTASELLSKPNIQQRIQEIISLRNPVEMLSENLADLREAKKEILDKDGNIVEVKDNSTRLGAVNACLKVMGAFGQEGTVIDARSVQFNVDKNEPKLFNSLLNKLDAISNGILRIDQNNLLPKTS